ncbi:hypothetical protein Pfo_002759 [Paulownia fortunei]|nr:hypothetical protein Pfo_002759 [Paulownia fortunei]
MCLAKLCVFLPINSICILRGIQVIKKILILIRNMKSLYILAGLFSLALFANSINARKDPGEYWQGGMKDEQMPELIQGLVDVSKVTSVSIQKNHCRTSTESRSVEQRPNISAHKDDSKLKEERASKKDFEPMPNISAGAKPEDKKSFMEEFEPRPNLSAYSDDVKPDDEKSFTENFEPRPNLSAYTDDVKQTEQKSFTKDSDEGKLKEEKSFVKDFEPRPNLTAYNDDVVGVEANKAFEKDFEPQPNVSKE